MKHKTPYIYLLPALLFLLLAASEASAELMSTQQIFAPLEYINLANAYDHYTAVIDLFIYGLIFIGVAQVTLGPRFAGRGEGRAGRDGAFEKAAPRDRRGRQFCLAGV